MLSRFAAPLAAAVLFSMPAVAADQDFQIVNRTGYQIDEVYVGASSSRSWGRDLLGRGTLGNNGRLNVSFPNRTSECRFDIRVVYNDGDEATWTRVNLCSISRVSLFWRNGTTRAETE